MHAVVEAKLAEIEDLCRGLDVRRLDLFGSAVGESFDPDSSDVDFLVEFDVRPGFDYFGTYFGLKEGLERILDRPVDLVSAASIRNPYFSMTREPLYQLSTVDPDLASQVRKPPWARDTPPQPRHTTT